MHTDIAPYRSNNIDIIKPDDRIRSTDETRECDPDGVHADTCVPRFEEATSQRKDN